MRPRHQVSRAAIELIKRFEGYRRKAAQLPDGRWTIGYGHTLSARRGAEVSEADAEALLLYDLTGIAHAVDGLVYAELTQNQFDALCAFAFSIGLDAFRGCDVLKRVNEGAFTQAAFALELWRKAQFEGERIVVDALVRRRAAEKLLFLTPPDGAWRPVPSAVLKPELDEGAPDTAPRETPAQVAALLHGEAAAAVRLAGPPATAEAQSPVTAAAEAVSARLQTLFPEPEPAAANEEAALEPAPEPAAVEPEAPPRTPPEEPMPRILREPAAPAQGRVMIDDTAPYEFTAPPVRPIGTEAEESPLAIVSLAILGLAFFAGGVFWALSGRPEPHPGILTPVLVGWLAGVAGAGFLAAAVFMGLQRMTRAAERREKRKG